MKKFNPIITILFVFFLHKVSGQDLQYQFSSQIESILKEDTTFYKFQTAAVYYSFIGDYNNSLIFRDKQFKNSSEDPTQDEKEIFSKYHTIQAKDYILKQAAKTRILVINEAHHIPLHRVYAATLLKDLKDLGYHYIGFEALSYYDTFINQRKYPIITYGNYTKEPCFGNLIREAIELGFTVFPYEKNWNDSLQRKLNREFAEALNIKAVIDKNPNAKFIIYCGYEHVIEDSTRNFMVLPMAGQLKRLSGIDPFTIDQTLLTEYAKVGSRYRKLIQENDDCLLIDSNKNLFNKASSPKIVDCNLYHPNTSYTHGRPNWLITPEKEMVNLSDQIQIDYPCIVKIYLDSDNTDLAVPVDIIELSQKSDDKYSVIYKHKKHIAVITNLKGEKQKILLN